MKCELCKEREADKKNTHYFTDAVIRQALNIDGGNKRERGFYFDMSNDRNFIEFNFQRNTPIEKFVEDTGRLPNQREIEKAKKVPFSVDNMFCSVCEKMFGEIENAFILKTLPKLRDNRLGEISEIEIKSSKQIRLFFYLQIWRNSICEPSFNLKDVTKEKLRNFILNHKTIELEKLNKFPLSITFLQTEDYTENIVGSTSDSNPYIIFLNDFIVQFYDKKEEIKYWDLYDINEKANYLDFINCDEDDFKIRVLDDDLRRKIYLSVVSTSKGNPMIKKLTHVFVDIYKMCFGRNPNENEISKYIKYIVDDDKEIIYQYDEEKITKKTAKYFYDMK